MKNLLKIKENIYITSDEEIKEGDWIINTANNFISFALEEDKDLNNFNNVKKIILTTDIKLIQDGVQAIPDEFLEWFVNNPSCEEVDVKPLLSNNGRALFGYKIIIPQQKFKHIVYTGPVWEPPKQETLEEAAKRWNEKQTTLEFGKPHNAPNRIKAFINGAKWQQERMYSEEEVYSLLEQSMKDCYLWELEEHYSGDYKNLTEWFEQFKKK